MADGPFCACTIIVVIFCVGALPCGVCAFASLKEGCTRDEQVVATASALWEHGDDPDNVELQPWAAANRVGRGITGTDETPVLIPILPYGLSNQVLALKEAMALASVLNWTVLTLGFWPHHSEVKPINQSSLEPGHPRQLLGLTKTTQAERVSPLQSSQEEIPKGSQGATAPQQRSSNIIPFDVIFDRQALAPVVRVITHEEAVSELGWPPQCRLDAFVDLRGVDPESVLDKATSAGLLNASDARMLKRGHFKCDQHNLDWLARSLSGKRWVALYSYRKIVPQARSSCRDLSQEVDPCAKAYQQVSKYLIKSRLVSDTAHSFLGRALPPAKPQPEPSGGGRGAAALPFYIALHVRPYPDTCLDYFASMKTYDVDKASQVCQNPRLLLKTVPLIRQLVESQAALAASQLSGGAADSLQAELRATAAAEYQDAERLVDAEGAPPASQVAAIFVMSHPRIRSVVQRELRRLWVPEPGAAGASKASRKLLKSKPQRRRSARRRPPPAKAVPNDDTHSDSDGGDTAAAVVVPPPLPAISLDMCGRNGTWPGSRLEPQLGSSAAPALPPVVFMSLSDLPATMELRVGANSLLSMVEQEVCRMAAAFIGTRSSSISVMLAQERVAVGAMPHIPRSGPEQESEEPRTESREAAGVGLPEAEGVATVLV